jgi:hypothetical protein
MADALVIVAGGMQGMMMIAHVSDAFERLPTM